MKDIEKILIAGFYLLGHWQTVLYLARLQCSGAPLQTDTRCHSRLMLNGHYQVPTCHLLKHGCVATSPVNIPYISLSFDRHDYDETNVKYIYTNRHIYIYSYSRKDAQTHTHICARTHKCARVYICVYIRASTHKHTHTHVMRQPWLSHTVGLP
jgi:hypothetical protein